MRNIDMKKMKIYSLFTFLSFFCTLSSWAQPVDSLSIKIGQMLLIGFPSTKVDSSVLDEIRRGNVGSILIFEKNIPPSNSFVELKKIIWSYQKAAPIPLLVCIDQEGGRVNRLKDKYGFPRSITAAAMAKAPTLDSVRFYAEATASTLAGLGININFAPVVDLSINPDNPIIAKFGRAFSADEDSVALFAKEFVRQHRKYGVLTSLKHFPGHGSSKDDTHLGIADVTSTWQQRELKPYKILIDSGYADAIMTSHIVNKKLDKAGKPGTLSFDIITGLLRNKLHYNGVVITDDMQMHAIAKHYGLEEAIKLAINAGVDIMTFSNNIAGSNQRTVAKVHSVIREMVESGEISKKRIDESYKRIITMKSRLITHEVPPRIIHNMDELERTKVALEQSRLEIEKLNQEKTEMEKHVKKSYRRKLSKKNK
jgi:beta-N-acetylhexosaminidase